jgi:xylulokinase
MKTVKFIAAIDCGTTLVKAAVFDLHGNIIAFASRPVACRHQPNGGVTQNATELKQAAFQSLRLASARIGRARRNIAAVAITNQRATLLPIGRDGRPLGAALSWQDLRGASQIAALRRRIRDRDYFRITGLPNHPVFSLAKILFLRESAPALFQQANRFVGLHDYLAKALGAPNFFMDHSNASLTGLLDIAKLCWSRRLLELVELDPKSLPIPVPSGKGIGTISAAAARQTGLPAGAPIVAGGGDQQCAGRGAGAIDPGICAITLGTAGVVFRHSDRVIHDPRRQIPCCVHALPGAWNLEGLQNAAGASLGWLTDLLTGAARPPARLLAQAGRIPPGARGLLYYPYLAGAAAPHWNAAATGMFLGLKQVHTPACLIRAVLEGVSFENRLIMEALAALEGPPRELRLSGGGANLRGWAQIQANIYQGPIHTLANPQATLLGAAILAAVGAGLIESASAAVRAMVRTREVFAPESKQTRRYDRIFEKYKRALTIFENKGLFEMLRED